MTCRTPRRLLAVLAAALIGAAAGQAAPASADAAAGRCTAGTGVTVVVDYGALGGGTSVGCDPAGARVAGSTVVTRAGFRLTYVARQPGFVCRVDGLPGPSRESCGTTPPQDAYWGLFWSDGRSGSWSYASVGIGSLKVPAGGYIGWRFQGSGARTVPRLSPVSPRVASPKPKPKPKPKRPRPTAHATPRPHATPKARPTHRPASHTTPGSTARSTAGPSHAPTQKSSGTPAASGRSATPAAPSSSATRATASPKVRAHRSKASAGTGSSAPSASASTSQAAGAVAAGGSPSGSTSPAPVTAADTDLQADERATDSPSALPVVAAGLVVLLLGSVGAVAYRRRS